MSVVCQPHNLRRPVSIAPKPYGVRVSLRSGDPFRKLMGGEWHQTHWFTTSAERDAALAARDRVRAGRLIGYVDAALQPLGSSREFTERGEYERLMATLSESLGADKLATLMKDGARWPAERAVSEALLI